MNTSKRLEVETADSYAMLPEREETGLSILTNRFSHSLDIAFKELSALEERLSMFLLPATEEAKTLPERENSPLQSDLNLALLGQVSRIISLSEQISELRNRVDL